VFGSPTSSRRKELWRTKEEEEEKLGNAKGELTFHQHQVKYWNHRRHHHPHHHILLPSFSIHLLFIVAITINANIEGPTTSRPSSFAPSPLVSSSPSNPLRLQHLSAYNCPTNRQLQLEASVPRPRLTREDLLVHQTRRH
jgi:hypothetical protein